MLEKYCGVRLGSLKQKA